MAVPAVGRAGFASGPLGLELRRSLGERCGLALGLIEVGPGRVEFASEAFVLPAQVFILPAELLELGAELLQLLQDAEGYGHRVEHLDRRHRNLGAGPPAQLLLCGSPTEKARGANQVLSHDPHYRRLKYVRYADDFLLGFVGPKSEAKTIRTC